MCLLFFITAGIFFNNAYLKVSEVNYIIFSIVLVFSLKSFLDRLLTSLILLMTLALVVLFTLDNTFLLFAELLGLWAVIYKKELSKRHVIFGIIASSFLLHLFFIDKISIDLFQHDLSGTRLYMSLIIDGGINWKNFDPWYMYYLFHQPLHFIILESIYLFEESVWQSHLLADEGLQYLSLLYVSMTTIFIAKILLELKIKKNVFYIVLALVAFNPTLTLFSAYISDDVPVLFWSSGLFYFVIRWYKSNSTKSIALSAIFLGFGCLSKLSILLAVPSIIWIFLIKLLHSSDRAKVIKDISLFIIITVPLSLVWIIRNHILFDMQFYNIPDTSPLGQNFNYLTLWDRLTDFSMINKPFIDAPYIADSNIFLAIIKTELFGEWDFSKINKNIYYFAILLYYISIALKILILWGMFYIIYNKKIAQKNIALMFIILYLSSLIYALRYAMAYPYICSTDYRLFTLLMVSEASILAYFANKNNMAEKLLSAILGIYIILSSIIYILVALSV
ncbi:MAG: glycosyltransferase family 39 protein [Alphaproteobacteria bacterium]|nr:glycosyltransferase family 39 protein [Alphaproteobacteria bacterium]